MTKVYCINKPHTATHMATVAEKIAQDLQLTCQHRDSSFIGYYILIDSSARVRINNGSDDGVEYPEYRSEQYAKYAHQTICPSALIIESYDRRMAQYLTQNGYMFLGRP